MTLPPSGSRQVPRAVPAIASIVLCFAFFGTLEALHTLARETLRHIVTSDNALAFQEVSDTLPVPRALDWNVPLVQTLSALAGLGGIALLIVRLVVLAVLGAALVWAVRGPASPKAPDGSADANAAPEFGRPQPARRLRQRIAILLLLYLFVSLMLLTAAAPGISPTLLRYYHTLGTFNQDYWMRIAAPFVAASAFTWSAAALALYAIFASGRSIRMRVAAFSGGAVFLLLGLWFAAANRIPALAPERDWQSILTIAPPYVPDRLYNGVPDGPEAARLLAEKVRLKGPPAEPPERPVLLFVSAGQRRPGSVPGPGRSDQALILRQISITEDGLPAGEETAAPVREFLRRRHYESALSWVAIKHLFAVAALRFDTTAGLDVCMTDLERCPHLRSVGTTTRGMLFICAASAANRAVLDRWADERHFAHPTRESLRLMGQLYERFGDKSAALLWYRRADMPSSFLARVAGERPLFHTGQVTGRLVLNGKPLAGVQVGVVPHRLNGLPLDMERPVLTARGELIAFQPYGLFPQYCPRPFAYRWISASAVTDTEGRFTLSDLTEGEYNLICALPYAMRLSAPFDPGLLVSNAPNAINVNYRHPARVLGDIALKTTR